MATRHKAPLDEVELRTLVRQVFEQPHQPMNVLAVKRALPKAWQASEAELAGILDSLKQEGMLWSWGVLKSGKTNREIYSSEKPSDTPISKPAAKARQRAKSAAVIPENLGEIVRQLFHTSETPLDIRAIGTALPRIPKTKIKPLLVSLRDEGAIYSWGQTNKTENFSKYDPAKAAKDVLLTLLREPISPKDIVSRVRDQVSGLADKPILSALKELEAEQRIALLPKRATEQWVLAETPATLDSAFAKVLQQFPDVDRASARNAMEKAFLGRLSRDERIEDAILLAEPQAKTGGVAWLPDVRHNLRPSMPKQEFDHAVLELARAGVLTMHQFIGNVQITEEERNDLVFDGKQFLYGGVSFRHE